MRALYSYCLLLFICSIVGSCSGMHRTSETTGSPVFSERADHNLSVVQESMPKSFEDLDSALKWRGSQCILHQSAFDGGAKVFDYFSGEAIPVREGVYVINNELSTSGGQRTVAFKSLDGAERFLSENGRGTVVTYDVLIGSEE